ncbi:hypothetical protein [Dactylosporangium sp. CS-033363]|uniref:hypothetical protein n=1 Tax=Dactylosporangium sp. CS-033363 TaxID=3239935 RepID=UPI003D8C284C
MSEPTLPPGAVQFYDGFRPGLEAGTYELTAVQRIDDVPTGAYFGPRTQSFTVDAPRFVLDAGDVGEVYPPANNSGDFGATLPSVVLNRRTLPWERRLGDDPDAPWLALLVLRADELGSGPALHSGTVAQFLDRSDPAVRPPAIAADGLSAQVLATEMTSLTLPRQRFTAIAPTAGEARLLAHVRRTDTASRAAGQAARDGWHAVVVANRLPAGGSANLACLVSLEGLAAYLPGAGGTPADGADVRLRLAVLASWTFTSNPAAGGDIGRLLAGLAPAGPTALLPLIPVPADAAPSAALSRLRQGYAALDYRLPTGERTFAWYRGPFTPYPAPALPGPVDGTPHYATAAEVTIYSQSEGVFDVSYAAAFEAGRLAALADRGFAVAMVNARRAAFQIVGTLQARAGSPLFADLAPASPPAPTPPAAPPPATPPATPPPATPPATPPSAAPPVAAADLLAVRSRDVFASLLTGGMGDRLNATLSSAPAVPAAPAAQLPAAAAVAALGLPLPALYLEGAADGIDGSYGDAAAPPAEAANEAAEVVPPRPPEPDLPGGYVPRRPGRGGGFDPVEQLKDLLSRADVQQLLAEHARGPATDTAIGWLAELALLHRVPFHHLIPDERMLPVESLRFFYLDSGWIAALIDGALSIGVEGSRDLELHQAISRPLVELVAAKVGAVRAADRGRPDLRVPTGGAAPAGMGASAAAAASAAAGAAGSPQRRAGLLLRSAVIAGWPGLAVEGRAGGEPVPLLRLDRLADTILLALFDGVPDTVTLTEPWHGLHFAFDADDGVVLRRPDGTELGTRFPAPGQPGLRTAFTRAADASVVRVQDLAEAVHGRLREAMPGTAVPMGSALFATEMLAAAHRLTLHTTSNSGKA